MVLQAPAPGCNQPLPVSVPISNGNNKTFHFTGFFVELRVVILTKCWHTVNIQQMLVKALLLLSLKLSR